MLETISIYGWLYKSNPFGFYCQLKYKKRLVFFVTLKCCALCLVAYSSNVRKNCLYCWFHNHKLLLSPCGFLAKDYELIYKKVLVFMVLCVTFLSIIPFSRNNKPIYLDCLHLGTTIPSNFTSINCSNVV